MDPVLAAYLNSGVAGIFLALGNTGTVTDIKTAFSSRGNKFIEGESGSSSLQSQNGLGASYNNNFYTPNGVGDEHVSVISRTGKFIESIDTNLGVNLTSVAINPSNGRMVVVGNNGGSTGAAAWADPPYTSWTGVSGFVGRLNLCAFVDGLFIAMGQNGGGGTNVTIYISDDDGESWTLEKTCSNTGDANNSGSIIGGNGHLLCIQAGIDTNPGYQYSADDGDTWNAVACANSLSSLTGPMSGVFDEITGRFYIFDGTKYAYSTNPSVNTGWTVGNHGSGNECRWAVISKGIIVLAAIADTSPFLVYTVDGTNYATAQNPFASPAQNGITVLVA